MKRLLYFIACGTFVANISFAQEKPSSIIVANWETSPGALNSSSGDQITYTRNPFSEGINTSNGVGKYTHKNGEWTTGEIQVGRLRKAANINPINPEINLGYYDSFEYKQYFPSDAVVSGHTTNLGIILCSDGPDRGTDPNVQRENWERQYSIYPQLPLNSDGSDKVNTWYKVVSGSIISGRVLEMIQCKFRPGESAPSALASTIYFDDFTFFLKKSNKICTYREPFYFIGKENVAWSGDPNSTVTMYPGLAWAVDTQTGAARWVGGAAINASSVTFQYEGGARDHYLEITPTSPEVQITDINILPNLTDLRFEFDAMSRTPHIEYSLDGAEWKVIDFSTSTTVIGPNWNTFTFPISTNHASKVTLKISGAGIANGKAYIDNLTIWGTDPTMISSVPNIKSNPSIRMYPNPVTDRLEIEGEGIKQVDIYDLKGGIVMQQHSDFSKINVSGLTSGMYIIKLHTTEGLFSSKMYKQ